MKGYWRRWEMFFADSLSFKFDLFQMELDVLALENTL